MAIKVTIHMVSSLDGFIASQDGSIEWMHSSDKYENGVALTEEYINEFLKSIDCYVMGAHTYEHALGLGWTYGNTPVIVLTSRDLKSNKKSVEFYSGDLNELINQLKSKYHNVWVVGGAEVTKALLMQRLADEIVVTIIPILLGGGKLFFDYIGEEYKLHLKDTTAFKDGMVELSYEILKN
ncbi:MAG: dihydrofolate reductase family protein [Bacteroidota bacterium]